VNDDDKKQLKDAYVSLYAHFKMLMDEREKQMNLRFDAAQEALMSKEGDLNRRLEGLNELRAAVEKDRAQFVKTEVYDIKTAGYDEWCRAVDKRFAYWGGGLTALVFVLEFIFRFAGK